MEPNTTQEINWEQRNEELKKLARRINDILHMGWFTTTQLAQKTTYSFEQAELVIEQLTIMGLVKTESKDGKYKHFITISNSGQQENLLNQKAYLQNQVKTFQARIDLINTILIETGLIKKEEPIITDTIPETITENEEHLT